MFGKSLFNKKAAATEEAEATAEDAAPAAAEADAAAEDAAAEEGADAEEAAEEVHEEEEEAAAEEEAAEGEEGGEEEAGEEEALEGEEAPEGEEIAAEEEADTGAAGDAGADINTEKFDLLKLDQKVIDSANDVWNLFISTAQSREAAGEAIYAALFEGAPSLQSLFVTPRAVQAMRFMNGLASFVQALQDPEKLKILVETLGFGHLHLEVTVPRCVIFRDAILDLFAVELGDRFTKDARAGWLRLLNYVGGALIYVKVNYAVRITCLLESWKLANDKGANDDKFKTLTASQEAAEADKKDQQQEQEQQKSKGGFFSKRGKGGTTGKEGAGEVGEKGQMGGGGGGENNGAQNVPTTYPEMFKFNSAVMGFGNNVWMGEVLACFDNIVTNVANSARLQEECDVLGLRIARVAKGNVNLAEYKSCMLASLRSLLPKDWSTGHEVAWSWLWENVERILQKQMGNPPIYERALTKLVASLDEQTKYELRAAIYLRFFALAPVGQDYFKQSNTYLHVVADKIIDMTVDIFRVPVKMVDDISALGLRHVGYGIPTELFGPFVTACVEVAATYTSDVTTIDAFSYSLALVSKMLIRTITEGSTIVMKAINVNAMKQLKKAIGCAPRGERSKWCLIVQVGTQSISPLFWAIKSGALESASAVIKDLLTIRADRDSYYYGGDELFARHHDIIKILSEEAPVLLPTLLNGLIWRARVTENGLRRVNYYIKHLLLDTSGKFHPTLQWIAHSRDPKIVCNPMIVLLSDLTWSRVAQRSFLARKAWFLFTLVVFMISQSIIEHLHTGPNTFPERCLVFGFRSFIYLFSLCNFLYTHFTKVFYSVRRRDFLYIGGVLPIPSYLAAWQEAAGFVLTLTLTMMLILEPIIWCWNSPEASENLFITECAGSSDKIFMYSVFSMVSMFIYFALLIDLAVFSTRVSAYVLVCLRMFSEVGLFILALSLFILMFAAAISVVKHDTTDFAGIAPGLLSLFKMFMRMYIIKDYAQFREEPVILVCICLFLLATTVFLLNLLIAQLTCEYTSVYVDMVGFARLQRIEVVVNTIPTVASSRWSSFVMSLRLNHKLEFNEGDIGLAGGVQTVEPASANPTTIDQIKRFGGSTSREMPWPEEDDGDENDKFDRLEALIQKTMKRLAKGGKAGKKGGGSSAGGGSGLGSGSGAGGDDAGSGASQISSGGGSGGGAGED